MDSKEFKKATKAELLELARSKNLRVTSRMTKTELIETLLKAKSKTKRKIESKPSPREVRPAKAAAKGAKPAPARRRAKERAEAKAAKPTKKKEAKKPAKAARKRETAERAGRQAPARRERRIEAETIRQKAEVGKYYLGAEERAMPPVEAMDIPPGYNVNRVVALVRDPHWIFTYWEVTIERYREIEKIFGSDWPSCKMILRVYDLSAKPRAHFDIELSGDARNWYINVSPERSYQVAVGALGPSGRFEELAISNIVETPRSGISDVIDDKWMVPDEIFKRIFAISGGHDLHASSAELRELLERRLLEQISSGAVSSIGSGELQRIKRGFHLWVATELILYGATEPNARVTIQGKEIKLRADGTFSLRFALPDGKVDIPVTAVSPDEAEERSIDTTVNKKSEQKEPVLR